MLAAVLVPLMAPAPSMPLVVLVARVPLPAAVPLLALAPVLVS